VKVSIKKPKGAPLELKHRCFVMIGMMRSGSNLLERYLDRLPDVRCHGELFNPAFIGFSATQPGGAIAGYARTNVAERNADEAAFLRQVDVACDRPIFGLRLFLDHSPAMTSQLLYDPAVKKIVLSRHLLESFVSLSIARDTNVWLTTREASGPPEPIVVEPAKFINYALRQSLYYNDILSVLQQTGQAYEMVDYTELDDLDRLNRVVDFIGSGTRLKKLDDPIKKQNPGTLAQKISNYAKLQEELKRRQMMRWFA